MPCTTWPRIRTTGNGVMKAGPGLGAGRVWAGGAEVPGGEAAGASCGGVPRTVTVWNAIEDAPRSSVARSEVVKSPTRRNVHTADAPVASSK
jgi:hypothetical protein